jgi:DNA-binding response OmpR family regulator
MRDSVLVVDDDRGIAEALAIRLRAAGFEATTAESGAKGLERARERRPDAIVLDVRMPELDGFELHARLKREHPLAEVPVVFVSANVQDSERQRALAGGAWAYLTKPYDAKEIVTTVRAAIDARRRA